MVLVSGTSFGTPRRMTTGLDFNRANLVLAVLEKKAGLKLTHVSNEVKEVFDITGFSDFLTIE